MKLDRELACQDIVELVTAYLEHGLAPPDRERFEEHLVFCDGCSTYLEQMRTTIALTGRLRLDDLSPEVQAELVDAFRGWRADSPG